MKKNKKIIQIKNLEKYFVNNKNVIKAVDKVSFDLHEGETIGIIGESGSGKTTIARSIVKLVEDYYGNIVVNGIDVSGKRISKKTRKHLTSNVQMIFQDPYSSLNDKMNVYSILKEALSTSGQLKANEKKLLDNLKETRRVFKYNFLNSQLKGEFDNQKHEYETLIKFYKELIEVLNSQKIEFESPNEFHEFISIFNSSTFEKRFKTNEKILSYSIKILDQIFNNYKKQEQNYKKNKLPKDELKLKKAINVFNKEVNLDKEYAKKNKEIHLEIKKLKNLVKFLKKEKKKILFNDIKKYKTRNKKIKLDIIDIFEAEKIEELEYLYSLNKEKRLLIEKYFEFLL
jgi:oligopeptide transport system ATP-binding protein